MHKSSDIKKNEINFSTSIISQGLEKSSFSSKHSKAHSGITPRKLLPGLKINVTATNQEDISDHLKLTVKQNPTEISMKSDSVNIQYQLNNSNQSIKGVKLEDDLVQRMDFGLILSPTKKEIINYEQLQENQCNLGENSNMMYINENFKGINIVTNNFYIQMISNINKGVFKHSIHNDIGGRGSVCASGSIYGEILLTPEIGFKIQKHISIEERNKFEVKLLKGIEKNLEKSNATSTTVHKYFEAKNSISRKVKEEFHVPISIFHHRGYTLRKISFYKSTTPKLSLIRTSLKAENLIDHHFIPFKYFKLIGDFNKYEIDPQYLYNMEAFIFDEYIGIPFIMLESPNSVNTDPFKITFVCHDLFDNFVEFIPVYKTLIEAIPNRKVILFNYPGQAYTISNEEFLPNNEGVSNIIDNFLCQLERKGKLNFARDILNFIGYGFGGNILLYHLVSAKNSIPAYKSIMLVNSFAYIDQIIIRTIHDSLQILEDMNSDIPELPFQYFYNLFQSQRLSQNELQDLILNNPINIEGRTKILNGCLSSINIRKDLANLEIDMMIVHSIDNALVHVGHVDIFNNTAEEKYDKKYQLESVYRRDIKLIKGGHILLRDDNPEMIYLINEFLQNGFIKV